VTGPNRSGPQELDAAVQELLDAYLDELLMRLRGKPRTARRLLVEAEDHLRTATLAGVAAGLEPVPAAHAAIERFGPPHLVARAHARTPVVQWAADVLVRSASVVLLLAVGALLAIGLAGGVAGVGALIAGPGFIAGNAPGAGASAADCTRWLALDPGAPNCAAAAAQDAIHDVIMGSGMAGVLGGLMLVGYLILQRVWGAHHARLGDPSGHRHAVAMTLFAAAAAVLIVNAVHNLHLVSTSIPGESLSLGIGAALVAAGFAARLLRPATAILRSPDRDDQRYVTLHHRLG
jgi:hypothetical protein